LETDKNRTQTLLLSRNSTQRKVKDQGLQRKNLNQQRI